MTIWRLVSCFVRQPIVWLLLTSVVSAAAPTTRPPAPTAEDVREFAVKTLSTQAGFDQEGLITRSQVKRLIVEFERKGWQVQGASELLERTLADDDFLVRQLSDSDGKKFLAKVIKVDGSLDRLDRIAHMPHGETNVTDLIHKIPNGADWITAMGDTEHGKRMAERLEHAQDGDGFNEPTGRIYTVSDLATTLVGRLTKKTSTKK